MGLHPWFSCHPAFDAVALVASAGGLPVFEQVLSRLPRDFSAPVLVLSHRRQREQPDDLLVRYLNRSSRMEVIQARDGCVLKRGTVYVIPPDRHLLVDASSRIVLTEGVPPRESRPSADLLFESLAERFGARCIVVVLSGSLSDGAIGAVKIKANGGVVLVQDPATATSKGMPAAAISTRCADFILPPDRVADALITLTMVPGATRLFSISTPRWMSNRN